MCHAHLVARMSADAPRVFFDIDVTESNNNSFDQQFMVFAFVARAVRVRMR